MICSDTELRKRIWAKATPIENYNPDIIRQDPCGAWIKYDMYGLRDNAYGWEIDHIVPLSVLKNLHYDDALCNNELNLRPINCSNNIAKGNDFPIYTSYLTADGEKNIQDTIDFRVNENLLQQLQNLFKELVI